MTQRFSSAKAQGGAKVADSLPGCASECEVSGICKMHVRICKANIPGLQRATPVFPLFYEWGKRALFLKRLPLHLTRRGASGMMPPAKGPAVGFPEIAAIIIFAGRGQGQGARPVEIAGAGFFLVMFALRPGCKCQR